MYSSGIVNNISIGGAVIVPYYYYGGGRRRGTDKFRFPPWPWSLLYIMLSLLCMLRGEGRVCARGQTIEDKYLCK
jgi:hypothetical protein